MKFYAKTFEELSGREVCEIRKSRAAFAGIKNKEDNNKPPVCTTVQTGGFVSC